jgi:hypothetical protein
MNIERLTKIAEWLEGGGKPNGVPATFDMSSWLMKYGHDEKNECGTACCIAGAAVLKFGSPHDMARVDEYSASADGIGMRLLELTEEDSDMLFCPDSYWPGMEEGEKEPDGWPERNEGVDAAWAARTIRRLIATGEVRWDLTKEAVSA